MFVFVSADVGEQIAQAIAAERFEAGGHQRKAGAAAALDIVLADGEVARRIAKRDFNVVLTLDNAIIAEVIFRLDADADEVGFDQAIGSTMCTNNSAAPCAPCP